MPPRAALINRFPFRINVAGTTELVPASEDYQIVTYFSIWANAANNWRLETSTGDPVIPASGQRVNFSAANGYDRSANVGQEQNGQPWVVPIKVLKPNESLQLNLSGAGEVVGTVEVIRVAESPEGEIPPSTVSIAPGLENVTELLNKINVQAGRFSGLLLIIAILTLLATLLRSRKE